MKPSLEKLIKFIKLEAERGYDNRSVVGGLDKIYSTWEAEARAESLPDELIQAVGARLRDYGQLTPASRADMLQGLWRRVQRLTNTNLPSLPQPPDRDDEEERQTNRPRPPQASAPRHEPSSAGSQSKVKPPIQRPAQAGTEAAPKQPYSRPAGEHASGQRQQVERRPERPAQGRPAPRSEDGTSREGMKGPSERPAPRQEPRPERSSSHRKTQSEPPTAGEVETQSSDKNISPTPPVEESDSNPRVFDQVYGGLPPVGLVEPENTPGRLELPPIEFEILPTAQTPAEQAEEAEPEAPPEMEAERSAAQSEGPRSASWANAPRRTRAVIEGTPAALNAPTTVLPGVGPRHAETIANLGLHNLGDMLYFFPRRYLDYSQLRPINRLFYGEEVTVLGMVDSVAARPARSGKMHLTEAVVSDGSGSLRVTWFNQPWLARRLHQGMYLSLSGKIDQYLGRLAMNNPEFEQLDQEHLHTNRIVPVYPLTANITQHWLRGIMYQVVTYWAGRVSDPLPESVRRGASLLDLPNAILQGHFPDSMDMLRLARHRLAFDEIFLLQIGVLRQKRQWQANTARVFSSEPGWLDGQAARLPFLLTSAQTRAIHDILADLSAGRPMNRLLQGDVGSGKTIVAALSMALIASQGAQSALMAPTSILAEQHYKNLRQVLCAGEEQGEPAAPLQPEQIRLMVGATSEAEKAEIRAGLEDGSIKIVIGTHALIEDPVNFRDLELVIIDEQHRFGVQQRAVLRSKGRNPHLLVMTATPIPRSLALTVYGDLELSVLDEMPPGRQPIETQVYFPRERERAYTLIRGQVEQDHQAFIIYPLVEESEKSEGQAAVDEHARLQSKVFPKLKLGLLHGRLKPEEKEAVMTDFRDGKIHILVSTSVVEVGVDVPNATVMMIESANRFGLAQLHQFRGRVGRGSAPSFCVLVPDEPDAGENARLQAMVETNDGFILAERDLEQRGPGDFLGTRQSGYHSELRFASLTDVRLIEKARYFAQQIFSVDPELEKPEHQALAAAVTRFWDPGQGDVS